MNHTEERLRAATRAAAQTVRDGSAPPLRLPADRRQPGPPVPRAKGRLAPGRDPAGRRRGGDQRGRRFGGAHPAPQTSPSAGPASQPARVSLPRVAMMLVAPVHGPGAGVIMHLEVRRVRWTGRRLT